MTFLNTVSASAKTAFTSSNMTKVSLIAAATVFNPIAGGAAAYAMYGPHSSGKPASDPSTKARDQARDIADGMRQLMEMLPYVVIGGAVFFVAIALVL